MENFALTVIFVSVIAAIVASAAFSTIINSDQFKKSKTIDDVSFFSTPYGQNLINALGVIVSPLMIVACMLYIPQYVAKEQITKVLCNVSAILGYILVVTAYIYF